MIFFPPAKFRKRPRGVGKLTFELVSATYDVDSAVTLKFNQPIDISAINGPAISVNDVVNGTKFVGNTSGAVRVDPFSVRVPLEEDDTSTGSVTTVSATDDTRIRSLPGAKSWAGVTDVPLPYP